MLDVLSDNHEIVAGLTSIGMLVVWIFYAQLLFNGYRRQRLPQVLINKGVGNEYFDSPCLICNMSQEPVFVYFMIVKLKTSEGIHEVPMTEPEGDELPDGDETNRLGSRTRQGPLQSGECMEFVTFRRMIERILDSADLDLEDGSPSAAGLRLYWLEVHVVSIYGPEHKPFGAFRRFLIEAPEEGRQIRLSPEALNTENRRSFRYRCQIYRWFRTYLQVVATNRSMPGTERSDVTASGR